MNDGGERTPRPSTAQVPWRGILVATGLGFVVYMALGLAADLGEVGGALRRFAPWTFVAALGLAFSNYLVRFAKWQYYLRLLGLRIPVWSSFRIFLAGLLMSVTPAKAGEVLRSVLLREAHGVPVARTAPIVVADRLSDMLALLILMSTGAAVLRQGWAVLAAGLLLCGLVVLAVQVPSVGRRIIALASRLPVVGRSADKLAEAYDALREVGSLRVLTLPVLISLVAWWCECVAFFLVVRGFPGGGIDLHGATFVYSFATVAGAVAMLPGGLGATEASLAGLLVVLPSGLDGGQAAAATVVVRLATLWFGVLVGLCALLVHRALRLR